MSYCEIYSGGEISGELVIETELEPDDHECICMTEEEYDNSFSAANRSQRGNPNYYEGYDVTTGNGRAVLHPSELRFDDAHIQALLTA